MGGRAKIRYDRAAAIPESMSREEKEMKKLFLFAAVAGFGLVSAGPPDKDEGPGEARAGYPPCSRTVTDHCIQLYERGVRSRENLARNHRVQAPAPQTAQAGEAGGCRCTRERRVLAQRIRRAGERG